MPGLIDLSTLERLVSELRDPIRRLGYVSVAVAAAGDYAALDVMSNSATDTAGLPLKLPDIARVNGGPVTIRRIVAKCSEDAVLTRLRLHWFNVEPLPAEVEMDDNIAFDIKTAAGRIKNLGSTLLSAFVDRGAAASVSTTEQLEVTLHANPASRDLWFVITTEDAEANETAGMSLEFEVYGF